MSDPGAEVGSLAVAGPEIEEESSGATSMATRVELFAIPILVAVGLVAWVWWRSTAELDSIESEALGWGVVRSQVWEHVVLTGVGALLTVAIGVPLGIMLTRDRFRRFSGPVVAVANAGQAAPGIGLFVLLYMWGSSLSGDTGIDAFGDGFWVSVAALTLYAVLPVLRNTIVGINGVDPTLVEAGRGVGMSAGAVLRRIELPLAVPVIMAGVRTALVLLVGSAALAGFINGGGLGSMLSAGISLARYPVIVSGAVLVALLALLIEWLGRVLELVARPKGV